MQGIPQLLLQTFDILLSLVCNMYDQLAKDLEKLLATEEMKQLGDTSEICEIFFWKMTIELYAMKSNTTDHNMLSKYCCALSGECMININCASIQNKVCMKNSLTSSISECDKL